MKKILVGIGIAFAVLVIIGITLGGEDETTESPTAAPTIEKLTPEAIKMEEPLISEEMAKEIFVVGCAEGEQELASWCLCTWDALIAGFGYEYVLDMSTSGTDEEMFEMNLTVVGQCISLWPE